jgi:hypothetical protein
MTERACQRLQIRYTSISRTRVRLAFAATGSRKCEIAIAICDLYSELRIHRPKGKKPWQSEATALAIFDAIALALTEFRQPDFT